MQLNIAVWMCRSIMPGMSVQPSRVDHFRVLRDLRLVRRAPTLLMCRPWMTITGSLTGVAAAPVDQRRAPDDLDRALVVFAQKFLATSRASSSPRVYFVYRKPLIASTNCA